MSQKQKKRASESIEVNKKSNKRREKEDHEAFVEDEEDENEESMPIDEETGLVFEDPYADEFEEEIIENNEGDEDEEGEEGEGEGEGRNIDSAEPALPPKKVWRPGIDQIPEGEELDYDPSAYIMYHSLRTEWPCLSFDVVRDSLGENRQRFPQTMYLVTGSQADRAEKNRITLLQLKDLHKTYVPADSDEESEEDENLDEDPTIEHVNVNHQGGVNRIRSLPQKGGVVASMSDTAQVHIYDLSNSFHSMLNNSVRAPPPTKPLFTFSGHREEGFAIDWSPVTAGRLATGDCAGSIHVWNQQGTSWTVESTPYSGHKSSVEDIQWSPTEATVFASASADKSVRIWDIRDKSKSQINFDAHSEDVNVISWNRNVAFLLASGSDDGSFKVWDLRSIRKGATPLANFTFHKGPITSIEWAPHDESMLAASSADNQISIWDLSVEADDETNGQSTKDPSFEDYPPQLLFLHLGQMNVKELHFHPHIPGTIISTAEDSFNIFKPAITVAN